MGGQVGRDIAQVGLGFMERAAEVGLSQQLQKKAKQEQFALQGATQLAKSGELELLPPDIQKSIMKQVGKENFALMQQQSKLNQALALSRKGARQEIMTQRETEMAPNAAYYGQLQQPRTQLAQRAAKATPESLQEAEMSPVSAPRTIRRPSTPEEAFQSFNQIGPLGVYLLTGDVQAGQLAQQQSQLAFDQMKYAQAPQRKAYEALLSQQAKWATENRRHAITTPEQIRLLEESGTVPEGFVTFELGNIGVMLEAPQDAIKIKEDVQTILAGMGVRDVRQASPKQIQQALKTAIGNSTMLAGVSAREKARMEQAMAEGWRLWDQYPKRAQSTFNRETGQLAPASLTVKSADSKEWKVLPDLHRKTLQEIQQARGGFSNVIRQAQTFYGKGGKLADIRASLPSRALGRVKAYWSTLVQDDPELAAFVDQLGQVAQVVNRGSYGGVGVQTEKDRQYAIKALSSLSDGTFLLDTPEVQQKKLNEVMKRFNRIEGTILGNQGRDFPGTVYMDVTKPAAEELQWAAPPITFEPQAEPAQVAQPQQQQTITPIQRPAGVEKNVSAATTEELQSLSNQYGYSLAELQQFQQQHPEAKLSALTQLLSQNPKKK